MTVGGLTAGVTPNYGMNSTGGNNTDALNEQKQQENVDQTSSENKKTQQDTELRAKEQQQSDQRAQQQQQTAQLTGVGSNFNATA